MLYSKVVLPNSSSSNEEEEAWLKTLRHLAVLTPVLLSLCCSATRTEQQTALLQQAIGEGLIHTIDSVVVGDEECYEQGLKWLDAGLPTLLFAPMEGDDAAFFSYSLSQLPRGRVGVSLRESFCDSEEQLMSLLQHRVVASQLHLRLSSEDILSGKYFALLDRELKSSSTVDVFVHLPANYEDCLPMSDVVALGCRNERLHIVVEPRLRLEGDEDAANNQLAYLATTLPSCTAIDLVDVYIAMLKSDRIDGLYTTLVCDVYDRVLGLVYSSKESIRIAFLSLRGVYFSRSRQSLWKKGESSGMHQVLISMRCDCDRDALKMVVEQQGQPPVFCHLLTRSCFGEDRGVSKLERVLQDRLVNAPVGSYTQRLYQDKDLLQKKLLEEVQELIEAEDKEDIASEAADVMYFMMVRCVSAGVTMADMERWLDKRSLKITRRPGHAKEWRSQEAEKILNAGSDTSNNNA